MTVDIRCELTLIWIMLDYLKNIKMQIWDFPYVFT